METVAFNRKEVEGASEEEEAGKRNEAEAEAEQRHELSINQCWEICSTDHRGDKHIENN